MNQLFHSKSHLHYGAVVYISCLGQDTKFYMYANGISFKSVLTISEKQSPYDPSHCLFVIKPVMNFQSDAFLTSILSNRYNQDGAGIDYDEKRTKAFIDQFEFELKQNIKLKQQQVNYPIKYNQNFMLQHVFSSNYLCFKKTGENNEYSLQLSEVPNTSCVFSLKACFNYQKDINTYIPFNSAALLTIKYQEGLQVHEMSLNFIPNSIFDSWMFSQESQDKVRFELYQTGEQIQYKNICYGDTVWIFHLESGSFAKIIDEKRSVNSLILNKIKYALGYSNERSDIKKDEISEKIIIQKVENQMSAEKFGLWQILPVASKDISNQANERGKFLGGKIKSDQEVRFLNTRFSAYLSVRKVSKGRNKFQYRFAVEETEQQNTVFQITSISSNNSFVTTQDLFLIKNVSQNTYLTLSVPFAINETQATLSPSSSYKKEDNFKFTKIDFLELWQNNYLLSTMPFINQGIRALQTIRQGQIIQRDEVMLRLMCQNLIDILSFSFDLTEGFEASESKLGKMTYNHYEVQKLLKQQGFISNIINILSIINPTILIDIISEPKKASLKMSGVVNIIKKYGTGTKNAGDNVKKLDSYLIERIVNICLKILRNCCKSNTNNSLIMFKNIQVVIKFLSMETYAENFMIDSMNNSVIMEKIGPDQFRAIIDQYIRVYKITKVQTEKIFVLLTKLITLDNDGVGKNQLEVYRLFFYKDNPLMIDIEESNRKFFANKIQLNQFCSDFPAAANILGYQIKFCAELTSDRNYICSKKVKSWFPLATILNYLIHNPVNNPKIRQSLTWIMIHTYLNERPRFKRTTPLVYSSQQNQMLLEQQHKSRESNYEVELSVMRGEGYSKAIIDDIFSCISNQDEMTPRDIKDIKEFVFAQVENATKEGQSRLAFYSSEMEAYATCLKYLIDLEVIKDEQSEHVKQNIKSLSKKVDQSLNIKKDNNWKLESSNFRELLLEMVQKNVIKKFNYSANFDGIEDEVTPDNICFIFINYSFYQNILLEQKDTRNQKQMDSVLKITLELIRVYAEIKTSEKIKTFAAELSAPANIKSNYANRSQLMKKIIIDKVLQTEESSKTDIMSLLVLLFYNSNTYEINSMSLNSLLAQIFSNRLAMQKLAKLQFNVDDKEKQQFAQIQKSCKNIKLLVETSEIWLNTYEIIKSRQSKYDTVSLLFINKLKRLFKIVMPEYDEQLDEPFYCYKFAKSIIAEKQQILANLNIHQQIISFINEYRPLMLKIKSGLVSGYNSLLIPLFKFCFLFMFIFIYDSPENKELLRSMIKESYLRDYCSYVDKMELGETMMIIEYLKNNYEESIEFYNKNPQIFLKYHKFTTAHSRLLLTLSTFYNEPVQANLRKFYITIFDFISYKSFMWLKPNGTQFNLDISLYENQANKQPFLYHIHAIEALLKVANHIEESRNTIRQHIRKSLSQEYLYSLLFLDDFYMKENSNNAALKVMVHFKSKVMKLIQFAYFTEEVKNDNLIINELRRQNALLTKFLSETAARQENEDFRKIVLMRELKQESENKKIKQILQNMLAYDKSRHVLDILLSSIDEFCLTFKKIYHNSKQTMVQKMVSAVEEIHKKVVDIYELLHRKGSNSEESEMCVQKFPVPYEWLFSISSSFRDDDSIYKKKYFSSFLIESIYSQQVYKNFKMTEKEMMRIFAEALDRVNLKKFLFLRKLAEYIEDAFEKLSNNPVSQMHESINLLIRFIILWIQCESKEKANQLRNYIGKSELIFPILNFFEVCMFDKNNKQLFLLCLQLFNELIGEDGNRMIQTIFNQYFINKADSIEFFMKIKVLFDAINFEDRANYRCKKIFDSIEQLSKDSKLESEPQFIILNFLIRLCKGNFRDNQIFLSKLSNVSSFNIMSGIWQILKYQTQKFKKNLVNVENYHLITQCFSTIRELVEGPCAENQNQFLKRDFFLTVLQYFQFEAVQSDLSLDKSIEQRLQQIKRISPKFTQTLRMYLNRDKITEPWMPSQVKYRCISLICSLLSENVSIQSKSQLYTLPVQLIIKELNKVEKRYMELSMDYTYENLQVKENTQIVLPLGFKLYELLQYYPPQKIPDHSPGLDFFRQNSRKVEVLHQKLCVVVFPKIPDEISQAFKTKFIEEVDRSSINSKLRALQNAQIQNKQSDYPYGYLILLCATITTILDIIIYNEIPLPLIQYFQFYPIFRIYDASHPQEVIISFFVICTMICAVIFFALEIKGAVYYRQNIKRIRQSNISAWEKIKLIAQFVWNNLTYMHYLIIIILSILTIFNPFFDAILLLVELNRRSETFSAIIDAITSTIDQLVVVLLFFLVCTYTFATFLYYYRAENDYPDQCQKLYNCFVFGLDLGLRMDAGIVGFTDSADTILTDFATKKLQDIMINFIYLFAIKVIIQQIIGAIIIDKFASLRQNKEKLEEDENSFCFICGLGRTELDREQDGFEHHKDQYHNIWSYLEFLMYLRKSKLTNFSGIELFVYDQQKNNKLNWFPISRSYHMELKNQQTNEKQEEEDEIEKIMKTMDLEINALKEDTTQIWNLLNVKLAKQQQAIGKFQ